MIKIIKNLAILLGVITIFPATMHAATLNLSPSKVTVGIGETKAVSVMLNTANESVNAVSAVINYPSDKLDVVYVNYGGTFPIAAESSFGGGSIRLARGSITGTTGNLNVATIGFKGKALGIASINFTGGTSAARTSNSTEALTGQVGSQVTVTNASKTDPITTSAKGTISNIEVSNITTTSASISWLTNIPSSGSVEYGLSKDEYLLTAMGKTNSTSQSAVLDGSFLKSGLLIHYRVKSKGQDNTEFTSEARTVQLKGYNVTLTLLDTNQKPIANTQVTLNPGSRLAKTTGAGNIVFPDMAAGKYTLIALLEGNEQSRDFTVVDDLMEQSYTLTFDPLIPTRDSKVQDVTPYPVIIFVLILILIIIAAFILYRKKRSKNPPSSPPTISTSPTTPIRPSQEQPVTQVYTQN